MGNIGPIRKETKQTNFQDQVQKEVKGTADSKETQKLSHVASSEAIRENAEISRKFFIDKFGKEYGNQIADALDKLRKDGKFVTFEAVRDIMESVFAKDKASFQKFKKEIDEIVNWCPHEISFRDGTVNKDYDPFTSEKVIAAMKKELSRSAEKMEENIKESDKERNLEKKIERKKAIEKKHIIEPKDKV